MNKILAFVFLFSFHGIALCKEVAIGLVSNFSEMTTGSSNPFGGYFRNGVDLAIADSEAKLKARDIQIKIQVFDYGTSDIRVLKAAREAVASPIVAAIGYNYSSNALLAAPIHQQGKLLMFTPSATANRVAEFKDYVRMGSFSNRFMAESLAKVAVDTIKARTAIIIPASDCAYCMDLASSFSQAFTQRGGQVLAQIPVLAEDREFSSVAQQVKANPSDVILVPNQEQTSARIIRDVSDAKITSTFLGADGWGSGGRELHGVLGKRKFKGYSVTHWHQDLKVPASQKFASVYQAKFGRLPNDTSVLAYDSMRMLIDAILKAKTIDREGVEASLKGIKKYQGVTGSFDYQGGGAPKKSLVLLEVTENGFRVIGQVQPEG